MSQGKMEGSITNLRLGGVMLVRGQTQEALNNITT